MNTKNKRKCGQMQHSYSRCFSLSISGGRINSAGVFHLKTKKRHSRSKVASVQSRHIYFFISYYLKTQNDTLASDSIGSEICNCRLLHRCHPLKSYNCHLFSSTRFLVEMLVARYL